MVILAIISLLVGALPWQTNSSILSGATGVGTLGGLAWNVRLFWSLEQT